MNQTLRVAFFIRLGNLVMEMTEICWVLGLFPFSNLHRVLTLAHLHHFLFYHHL